MKNPKETIIQILEIINYQNDREKFADTFIELCIKQAFAELLGSLPPEKTAVLTSQVKTVKSLEEFIKLLRSCINPLLLERKIEQSSAKLFDEYIREILPTLDPLRKTKLLDYIGDLSRSSPTTKT